MTWLAGNEWNAVITLRHGAATALRGVGALFLLAICAYVLQASLALACTRACERPAECLLLQPPARWPLLLFSTVSMLGNALPRCGRGAPTAIAEWCVACPPGGSCGVPCVGDVRLILMMMMMTTMMMMMMMY